MKAKFNKANKFMWSVIEVYVEGEDGYRIQPSLGIYPVNLKPFGNIRKAVKKHLVKGDDKCLYWILNDKDKYYKVFMFARTTSENEFIDYEYKVAELIVKEKFNRGE